MHHAQSEHMDMKLV